MIPGAAFDAGVCTFTVWAPDHDVDLVLIDGDERVVRMSEGDGGYHVACVDGVAPGARYLFQLDGALRRPDPASRHQPDGVHGPSAVVDDTFPWSDAGWRGPALSESVFYELHVGTFTDEGTFAAVIAHLPDLVDLGVTTIELMPVAQCPGARNWGYDGVYPWAVQHSYGGPRGLQALIDACHAAGLAVVLDVVYNHLGPEGCYLSDFAPYFTDTAMTPWGRGLNFDGVGSDEVRRFFRESAVRFVEAFHVDGFRLDAVDSIVDRRATHMIEEITAAAHDRAAACGQSVIVVAEDAENDPRRSRSRAAGGWGLDGQWSDDSHHALDVVLTGPASPYAPDYAGIADVVTLLRDGWVYGDRYSPRRGRRVGVPSPPDGQWHGRLVGFLQNHDQVANRPGSQRLAAMVGFETDKVATGLLLLSPFVPLMFMGEEYGEQAPFLYFVDHSDADLVAAVRRGRVAEMRAIGFDGDVPDPTGREAFERSRLNRSQAVHGAGAGKRALVKELLALRRRWRPQFETAEVSAVGDVILVRSPSWCALFNFGGATAVELVLDGDWTRLLDSSEERWGGPGSELPLDAPGSGDSASRTCEMAPSSFAVYERGTP